MIDIVKEKTEDVINDILQDGINGDNIDMLGKVIDIHKDVANEEYWKIKEEDIKMRYDRMPYNMDRDEYDYYGRGRRRDSRGRYMGDTSSYDMRRMNGQKRYRGHDMIDDIYDRYGNYAEMHDNFTRGNYGNPDDTIKSLECMLESVEDFMMMLEQDASSQEEVDMIKRTARKISDM